MHTDMQAEPHSTHAHACRHAHTHTHTQRQTKRQTDSQPGRQANRQMCRQTDGQTKFGCTLAPQRALSWLAHGCSAEVGKV